MEYEGGLRTYESWIIAGSCVKNGQKAGFFLLSDDEQRRKALFSPDQTIPLEQPELIEGWTKIVPAEQVGKKKTKPKAIVTYNSETKLVSIWVGPNKNAIKELQHPKTGFTYKADSHRWVAIKSDINKVIEALETFGCRVDATVDGDAYLRDGEPVI